MTSFNFMSDLHLEFGDMELDKSGDAEHLLLAGDVGIATKPETYMPFLERVCQSYKTVTMVMGNHEHYTGDFLESYNTLKKSTEHLSNFSLLENETTIIDDVKVIGATMWSDIPEHLQFQAAMTMNDYQIVDNISPESTTDVHKESVEYIKSELDGYDGLSVVLTHHAPTMYAPEEYRGNDGTQHFYGSNLHDMILDYNPTVWIHGHTHVSENMNIGDTPVLCNPRGYKGYATNEDFNPDALVVLDITNDGKDETKIW